MSSNRIVVTKVVTGTVMVMVTEVVKRVLKSPTNLQYVCLPIFQVFVLNRASQPSKKSKTGAEVVVTGADVFNNFHTIASLASNISTLQARLTRLDTHSEQLRSKAGVRSALESDQAGSEETRSSDHLLALQFTQLIDEYRDVVKKLFPSKVSPFWTPLSSFQQEIEKIESRIWKLRERVQDLGDEDDSTSEDNRLCLVLALGQLTRVSEDLAGRLMLCVCLSFLKPSAVL